MLKKFATAAILDARMGDTVGFAKGAHRAVFNYIPKPGFLYVRSRAISSRCNDNFDMFPAEEIEKSYLSFIGKPVFVNHHNEDHRRARGVIIDAALHRDVNPDGSPDTWVEVLHEVDAVKFPRLAKAILAKDVNRTSMGCDVQFSKCSVCDNVATSPLEYCAHIPGKKGKRILKVNPDGTREARLVYEVCSGLSFFENSLLVEQPADPTAFFLGEVEYGPGLETMVASVSKTAAFHPASPTGLNEALHVEETNDTDGYDSGFRTDKGGIHVHDYPRAINELQANWNIHDDNLADEFNSNKRRDSTRRREVGKLIDSLKTHHQKESSWNGNNSNSIWNLIKQAADEERAVTNVPNPQVWDLIKQADLIGDDLDNDLEPRFAMNTSEAEDFVRKATEGGKGTKNILDLVGTANHAELKSGMKWYDDAHGMAKSMVKHYQGQEGHMLSKDSHEDALHKVAGTIGVYSEGTAPAPNFHYASEALHHQRPVYSHPQFEKDENGKDLKVPHPKIPGKTVRVPKIDPETGQQENLGFRPKSEYHGLPVASATQAGKIRAFFGGAKINDVMKDAHKTRNYSSLIENPNSLNEHGKERVVIDRHAIAAAMGHKGSSGDVYDGKGSTFLGRASGDKDMHPFRDGNYEHVADMYRDAAHHINNNPEYAHIKQRLQDGGLLGEGESVKAHHVQAISWIKQKQISDSHGRNNSSTQRAIDDFHSHYTNRYGDVAHKPASWQGFAGGDARHGSRRVAASECDNSLVSTRYGRVKCTQDEGHEGAHKSRDLQWDEGNVTQRQNLAYDASFRHQAYGETKAPQDVDTLRAENCTVCGNSTAFDGVQCQICGYVAPPRPFGDPDTDTAKANDMRKQVLDSADNTVDPTDPTQQMGNQIGNPEELEDQASDAQAAGQIPALTCDTCGTGIQPAPPVTDGGEPPYPAEGDVCPVCKKGGLTADGGDEADEDMDGDGVPDDEEDESDSSNPFAKSDDSDDDEDDDENPPKKKKDK